MMPEAYTLKAKNICQELWTKNVNNTTITASSRKKWHHLYDARSLHSKSQKHLSRTLNWDQKKMLTEKCQQCNNSIKNYLIIMKINRHHLLDAWNLKPKK